MNHGKCLRKFRLQAPETKELVFKNAGWALYTTFPQAGKAAL
jgi:hypothetical protein